MKILLGTTNPSKVAYFEEKLQKYDVEFITLKDLHITDAPEEAGSTPEENAVIKARFYGKYFDTVICDDSGLYLDALPMDDPRQPGLHVRSPQGRRLDDDEMVTYYTGLIHDLGGRVQAYWLNGIAVCRQGKIYSYLEERADKREGAFTMVDHEVDERHPGWPLDSISIWNEKTESVAAQRQSIYHFLVEALGIEK